MQQRQEGAAAHQALLQRARAGTFLSETSDLVVWDLASGDRHIGEIPAFCRAPGFTTTVGIPARSIPPDATCFAHGRGVAQELSDGMLMHSRKHFDCGTWLL